MNESVSTGRQWADHVMMNRQREQAKMYKQKIKAKRTKGKREIEWNTQKEMKSEMPSGPVNVAIRWSWDAFDGHLVDVEDSEMTVKR